jgi:hypothetical protein
VTPFVVLVLGPYRQRPSRIGAWGRNRSSSGPLARQIEHPTSILTDSKPPMLPLAVQIVGADGSETLVTVLPRVEEG